jgi:hypothetical protein
VLRVTSLQLASDGTGSILSAAGTPVGPKSDKVIFFGDSITEGYHDTADERAYSADVATLLGNVEYGQIAYSGAGWDISAPNNVPDFYVNPPDQSTSSWENYNSSSSRLVNPSDLSSGFIGGAPDAVYVNMGINDADNGAAAADLRTKADAWLSDIRATIGPRPEVFVIVPFNFGSGNLPTYKADLLAGVSDYESAHRPGQQHGRSTPERCRRHAAGTADRRPECTAHQWGAAAGDHQPSSAVVDNDG